MKRLGVWEVHAVDIGWHRIWIYPLVYYVVEWRGGSGLDWAALVWSGEGKVGVLGCRMNGDKVF
jgi:hypothetical protein